jgi:uncharacterized membrane protein YkvA (DUF1232 family)
VWGILAIAAIAGLGVVIVVWAALALAARLLPAGPARELVGFLPNCVVLLRRLRSDAALPRRARLALGVALAYVVSPVQLIPNIVPVIGQSDDIVVVAIALRYACRRLPRATVLRAWPGDAAFLDRLLGPDPEQGDDRGT